MNWMNRRFLLALVFLALQKSSLIFGFGVCTRCHDRTTSRRQCKLDATPSDCGSGRDRSSRCKNGNTGLDRRDLLRQFTLLGTISAAAATTVFRPQVVHAAPPIAVISEELGYFPVTNKEGQTMYVPARARRSSSDQAIALAKKLKKEGAIMYGAFWCPHCKRQKELFGREAWQYITYVECSPKGYAAKPNMCLQKEVDGYPTWIFRDKTVLGGERELAALAEKVKAPFDPKLEENVPPPLGSTSCKQ